MYQGLPFLRLRSALHMYKGYVHITGKFGPNLTYMWHRSDFFRVVWAQTQFFFHQRWDISICGPKQQIRSVTMHQLWEWSFEMFVFFPYSHGCSTLYITAQVQINDQSVSERSVEDTEGCHSCTAAAVGCPSRQSIEPHCQMLSDRVMTLLSWGSNRDIGM